MIVAGNDRALRPRLGFGDMRRSQLQSRLGYPAQAPVDACGYVYVLATAYRAESGVPIVKIGMTKRTPRERVAELSRGGPVGMILEGFVTSRDPRALERWAHQNFLASRFAAGGGTEYFAVNPAEVLTWLREASPRFELDSAKRDAWSEYCVAKPVNQHRQIMRFPLYCGGAGFLINIMFGPSSTWADVLWLPITGLVSGCLFVWVFLRPLLRRLSARSAALRSQLEEKYHLPLGSLGPS